MKRILFTLLVMLTACIVYGQVTYYWVGGTTPSTSITTGTNWNSSLDGTGSSRPSSTGATDILVFDGSNVGGSTPATGPVTVLANGSITCGQMKLVNNAAISFIRATTGTSTITISGEAGEDFVVEAGSSLSFTSTIGSIRMAMAATTTGRVSGAIIMITPLQARFDNTTSGTAGSFVFTSGASLTSNITSASSSYAFGGNTQSSEKWVVFEDGSHIYYEGGFSPMGNNAAFSPLDMKPGSTWHHRANNGGGSFFNRKSFGNIIVENNATLTADGPIYRINNLTVTSGSTFLTHSAGQTAVMGDLIVNGTLSSDVASTNELIMAGNTNQVIDGTGTVNIASLLIGESASVSLNKNISVDKSLNVIGKLDFNNFQVTGNANFTSTGIITPVAATGRTTSGSYMITQNAGVSISHRGYQLSGPGIAPNTVIISFSSTNDTIYVSHPLTATATGVALSVTTDGAVLQTANANGFNTTTGSVATAGTRTFDDYTSYIIDGATSSPFGVSTGSTNTEIIAAFVEFNAAVTVNKGFSVRDHVTVNGKITLRPLDTLHVLTGGLINGAFGSSSYIATTYNGTNGDQSIVRFDGATGSLTLPVGTENYYLPVTLSPASASDFTVAVFEGITANGTITGTPLTSTQKQTVVNAVWNINRLNGSGTAGLQLSWNAALEGSTFTTLPDSDIGVITNTGSSWTLPIGTGNNTTNIVSATVSSFGAFGAGAVPPTQPFVFNPLPVKTYGDADFDGGATSLNTTQPIVYSSSNPSVATIVAGSIHITGAGVADITASQATDGFYPAASVTRTLTVNPAALTITADNKTKFEGQVNPTLTVTYTGFVYGESASALLTPPTVSTTATTASGPGTYPITVSGATSNNYTITFVNGTLTVQARQNQTITFNALPTKTYGNADFPTGATSTNNTIPITYTSSNPGVATVTGNLIHITGAGTTTITASQAGNAGYFPATDVARTLTVNKAPLTIRVRDTLRTEGQPNPPFVITYTGFVLGETAANLLTPVVATTTATELSAPGYYPITLSGGNSDNYNVTYVNARLTVLPASGTDQQHLNVYMSSPNTITVRVYSPQPYIGDITLYDFGGRPLLKKNLFMPVGFISTDLQVPTLPSGIYIITIKGDGVDLKKTVPLIR